MCYNTPSTKSPYKFLLTNGESRMKLIKGMPLTCFQYSSMHIQGYSVQYTYTQVH